MAKESVTHIIIKQCLFTVSSLSCTIGLAIAICKLSDLLLDWVKNGNKHYLQHLLESMNSEFRMEKISHVCNLGEVNCASPQSAVN